MAAARALPNGGGSEIRTKGTRRSYVFTAGNSVPAGRLWARPSLDRRGMTECEQGKPMQQRQCIFRKLSTGGTLIVHRSPDAALS